MKTATIVGAGLVGSLWSIFLSKAGYKVTIFEKRDDLRKQNISAGKSINLAFSERGWTAFRTLGIEDQVRDLMIPMYGRTMHDKEGNLTYQPYGQEGQAIFSVSRGGINCRMMDLAESHAQTEIRFNEKCIGADLENGVVYLQNTRSGEQSEFRSDVVFGADGAFSSVRYSAFQKLDRFQYHQNYIEDGYLELLLPANKDGSYKLDKNTLHIWPRGRFMLIALPNEDGSFTCTLFMPFEDHEYAFDKLDSKSKISSFFREVFPDFYDLMPDVANEWDNHPLSSLAIIRCYPWAHGRSLLIGDAAHATVPFYGQGMNSGFEDCTILWQLMQKHGDDWPRIFDVFQKRRKPEGDAIQDLSLHNYHVMRDYVADPQFLLQKKFEHRIQKLYPDQYVPLYSQVSFSNISYAEALASGKKQDEHIKSIMTKHDIQSMFENDTVDELIHKILGAQTHS